MIIAIASEGNSVDSKVSDHFGRCRYFAFIEINNEKIEKTEFKENPHYENHEAFKVPDFIKASGANCLITGGIGPKAIERFNNHNISVFQSNSQKTGEALSDFVNNKLKEAGACK